MSSGGLRTCDMAGGCCAVFLSSLLYLYAFSSLLGMWKIVCFWELSEMFFEIFLICGKLNPWM
jgi:hypothetical protein